MLQTLHKARLLGFVNPWLIGDPAPIETLSRELDFDVDDLAVVAARDEATAAAAGVRLVREGVADAVMKGHVHTDVIMRELLHDERGLRVAGRRVSYVFAMDIPTYPKLLLITDAAINIAPDLNAKAQIVQNALEVAGVLGIARAKVAALSAVETVNPAIVSTLDAAALKVMGQRGQINNCLIDGPLAFDNAISADAARKKGIESDVAGDADIVLVPDLVSGNILAKNLEYLADIVTAGVVVGLSAPVILSSRADPPAGRLAGIALAALMHHETPGAQLTTSTGDREPSSQCAPLPESACRPPVCINPIDDV